MKQNHTQNFDIAIIGGGIIGSSIACHLAEEKLRIAVINTTNLGTPASVAAAGLLTPFQIHEIENSLLKGFCFKSFDYFHSFYEKIKSSLLLRNIDLGFKQCGTLYLIFSNLEIAGKEKETHELRNIDSKISFLTKQDTLKYEPKLTKELIGSYYFPQEALINNAKFLNALLTYSQEKKVTYINDEVIDLKTTKRKIENIYLASGKTISADTYVLCNGAWANTLLKKIYNTRENIISVIKGEILQVEGIYELPLQKIIFCNEGYILPRIPTNSFEQASILVGSTQEEVDLEKGPNIFNNSIKGISHLTNLLQKILPSYSNFTIYKMWAGLRPKTIDNLPLLGEIDEMENLYLALGHYRNGILMGPYTGKILRDLILGKEVEYNIEPFKFERLFKSPLLSKK